MNTDQDYIFEFESELEKNLTFIPIVLRFKLDRCGIKLSLSQWNQMPVDRRVQLLALRCDSDETVAQFRRAVIGAITEFTGEEPALIPISAPPRPTDIPRTVIDTMVRLGHRPPSVAQWQALTELQRFALKKLTRNDQEHRNLVPALREFGLLA